MTRNRPVSVTPTTVVLGAQIPDGLALASQDAYADLDVTVPSISEPVEDWWETGEPMRIITGSRGYRYVLGDKGGGDDKRYLRAYDQPGVQLWGDKVYDAMDSALGVDGWIYLSHRGRMPAYFGEP